MLKIQRMSHHRFTLALTVFACFLSYNTFSQRYIGLATSDYNALTALALNPANISGCNEKISVNLFSLNAAVDNNLGTFTKLSNLGNSSAFNVSGTKPFDMLAPALNLRLPEVLVSLNDKLKQSFAIGFRIRLMDQFNNFDPNLYNEATSSNHTSNDNLNFVSNNFNWTAHVWGETGITYGLQVFEKGPHQLRVGATLKYLGGIAYLGVKGKNLDVNYKNGNDTFYANHSDLEFASNAISANNAINNGVQPTDVLNSLFGSRSGSGFGLDIGVTYSYQVGATESNPHPSLTDPGSHRVKASVAVTDIGAIQYKEGNNFVINVSGNGYLTGQGITNNIKDWNDFRNYMVGQGFTADTGSKATKLGMPTALVLGGDYQVHSHFFVNATYIANLANRANFGNSYYNQFTITPRWDTRLLTLGLPITYSMLANDVKMGLGFRFGGFYFGSDDIMALFSNSQYGFNFYLGAFVPIYRKTHKHTEQQPG